MKRAPPPLPPLISEKEKKEKRIRKRGLIILGSGIATGVMGAHAPIEWRYGKKKRKRKNEKRERNGKSKVERR